MKVFLFAMLALTAAANEVTRVQLPEPLMMGDVNVRRVQAIDDASWIWSEGVGAWRVFRCVFTASAAPCRIHVSADMRYTLKLDGQRIARGPDRGTVERWTYQTYDLRLTPGQHTLEAVVQGAGQVPLAQLHYQAGFILKAEGDYDKLLTTGRGAWQACAADITYGGDKGGSFGVGAPNIITDEFPGSGAFGAPQKLTTLRGPIKSSNFGIRAKGWMLYPSPLPAQIDLPRRPGRFVALADGAVTNHIAWAAGDAALEAWNNLLAGKGAAQVPANTTITLLWDLGDYYCAWPQLRATGSGAEIKWGWCESLTDAQGHKAQRNEFIGKHIVSCFEDTFLLKDSRTSERNFETSWWRCGRWCRLTLRAGSTPLTISSLLLNETHYPIAKDSCASFACDDSSLNGVRRICLRGLEMCSHEMGFDCPFYEQQMYGGDTRVQLLIHHALYADSRFTRRAIDLFDYSRRSDGRVGMNFPTTGTQESSTYTFCWPMMLADAALWRDEPAWLRARLPGLEHTLAGMHCYENSSCLVQNLPGWSFMDWTGGAKNFSGYGEGWPVGVAPEGNALNAPNNLFYLYALQSGVKVATALGEEDLAVCWRHRADRVAAALIKTFWDEAEGLIADDPAHKYYSEHSQALAILTGILTPAQRDRAAARLLANDSRLAKCTVYFAHYLFDAFAALGRMDLFLKRLDLWRDYVKMDMKTPLESPGDARSDCHAWGSHPIYHLLVNVAGIKPSALGFKRVTIAPQPGPLKFIRATMPHPAGGNIALDLTFANGTAHGSITLPAALAGDFVFAGRVLPLVPGLNKIGD